MYKRLLLALALFGATPAAYAQDQAPKEKEQKDKDAPLALPFDSETHQVAYTGVIDVPGATKNELYARGKVWFANAFKSAQNVIQADDKDAGLLVGKGWTQTYITIVLTPASEKLWYTVKLSFKDGKYRYVITDFMFESEYSKYNTHPAPHAAEPYVTPTKKDGTPTNLARKWGSALDASAQKTVASIQAGMSKAAAGSDW